MRQKTPRLISELPSTVIFIPQGVSRTEELTLTLEGLEAIRQSDYNGLKQQAAAQLMEVSRATYGKILAEARRIVAEAIIVGKTLKIQGGAYTLHSKYPRKRNTNREK